MANYAKKIDSQAKWNRDDWIPAFYSTHQGIVQSLEYLHNDDLKVENYQGLTNQIKYVGRDVGCNYIYLVPKTLEQKMLCEAFAQKTRIVQDIYFEKEDETYELSNYSGGDIFSSITKEEIKMDDSINYKIINEEDKDIMEKKEQNPWFEKLSDIEKEAVLSDMRINPDLIGEYHSELEEANIDYKEYDRPSDEWFLNKINYKNLDGEFSYFNENNMGQQRHYAEVINEYKQELAAKQEINDEVMDVNDSLPETALEADLDRNINENQVSVFDKELLDYKNGILGDSHIFNLGKPSEILQKCGFPPHDRIELASARLKLKSQQTNHPFDIEDLIGLDKALKSPIAVFEYGDKNKSQNVIVNLEKDGKNFLVGVFFNQKRDGFEVSSIRGLFNRDNIDWIRWIEQGKMIYGNKEKIQVSIAQQRTNLADVNNQDVRTSSDTYYLDSTNSILVKFGDVNDIFTKEFEFYKEQKERNEVFKKFRNYYAQNDSVEFDDAKFQSDEFYDALENKNIEILKRYTSFDDNYEISNLAREILSEKLGIPEIKTSEELETYLNQFCISPTDILTQKINGSDVSVHLSKEEMQKILDEGKKTQNSILHEEDEFEPKYVDYEVDCSGMGILSVSNFIEEIENRNNDTILTVNCSDGSAYHTLFDKESWEEFKDSKNSIGTAITKVWVTEEYNRKKHELEEERKLNQKLNEKIQYLKTPDGELYGFVYNNEIYVDENLVNSNVLAHEYTHVWDNYVQKNNPDLWDKGMVALKNTSLWQEVVNDKNYAELTTDSEILSECHARIVGKMAEKVLNRIAEIDGELTKDKIIDWDKEVSEYIATELLIKPELGDENYISESIKAEYLKEFLAMPMKDLMNEVKLRFEQEHKIENPQKELNEFINNDIPVMPNISDLQHSESNEVQILKKEVDELKAALKQVQSQFEHQKKENNTLRQENELLKGKNNNINATQNVKETGEESLYREETKDTGTEINFNRNTAFNINCPIPPFGHEKEDGSIEIIENAHFAKHLLNKYDSASNKVVLTYADETGKHHEIEMHEREYRKMINACEEFAEKFNGVAENSYEWYLLHEKKAKIMKTDQNVLRLNFASNFIHNYRIMCKLYASNEGEAVKQAQKLVDMMHPNERRTFNKWRKQVGEKSFDNLLLKEFRDHVQGIENKDSLILNNNELLFDVNKRYLEFQKDEEIVLTKNDKVIKNSGKKIGDTIKMAFKYESFGGKKLKTPMLEYQILKVTKNQSPDTVLLYNAEQKITQTIPLKDFIKHVRKIEKQQLKENAEQIKKDYKIYGYEGR